MSPSSTSSSERFRNELNARGLLGIAASLALALAIVLACEAGVRVVRSPKALPFESTRTGTMVELALDRSGAGADGPLDVAFVGSSQCVGAVSPRAFSAEWESLTGHRPRALNLGVNGAVVRDVESFHEVVVSRLAPRLLVVLVGVPGAVGTGPGGPSRSYGMDWLRGDAGPLGPAHDVLMQSWLFRYRRQWRDARWQFYVARTRSLDGDLARRIGPDGDGWVPSGMGFGVFAPVFDHGLGDAAAPPPRWTMPADAIDAVRGILRRGREAGTRVVLVVPPLAPRSVRLYGDLDAAHVELRRGLEAAMDGGPVPLLDLHAPEGFSDAQFYDPWHVHGSAADAFSKLLAREIAEIETLP